MKRYLVAIGFATLAASALAQPYGPGYGRNGGPAYGCAGAPGPGCAGANAGYSLLTDDERLAFRDSMHAATTVDQCKALVAERRQLVEARAREKGVAAPPGPNDFMCERMKARGLLD